MSLVTLVLGVVIGLVVAVLSAAAYKWMTKQVNDAKTHLPGA